MKKKLLTLLLLGFCMLNVFTTPIVNAEDDVEYVGTGDKDGNKDNPDASVEIEAKITSIYSIKLSPKIDLEYSEGYTYDNVDYLIFKSKTPFKCQILSKMDSSKFLNLQIIEDQFLEDADRVGNTLSVTGVKMTNQEKPNIKGLALINVDNSTINFEDNTYPTENKANIWRFSSDGEMHGSVEVPITHYTSKINGWDAYTLDLNISMRVISTKVASYSGNLNLEVSVNNDVDDIPTRIVK